MKKAFTLIELLVVIAIIAILAAIVFPVFAQAKNAAKTTACLSNAKQIGLGTMQYLADSDGDFPKLVRRWQPLLGVLVAEPSHQGPERGRRVQVDGRDLSLRQERGTLRLPRRQPRQRRAEVH